MIIREKEPANLEMPFQKLDGFLTPNDQFYVRSHFPVPHIDLQSWRLKIEGAVERPFALSYDELMQMAMQTHAVTMECAGNNRVFLVPKVKGAQWELGAVGNAEWTGVLLRDLLERAGGASDALEVILEGADQGRIDDMPKPAGEIHFSRSLPREKAMQDVLLAVKMNGEPLSAAHGFPVRAIVPGWYGMAAIKWLQRIVVTRQPYNGYYQTVDYSRWQRGEAGPVLLPLGETQVKAQIARPGINEIVSAGLTYRVIGSAWTGDSEITKVEFSEDGGESWHKATLIGESVKNAWRLWQFDWLTPRRPGWRVLMARATDARGVTQPATRDPDHGTYMINHYLPIEVEIR